MSPAKDGGGRSAIPSSYRRGEDQVDSAAAINDKTFIVERGGGGRVEPVGGRPSDVRSAGDLRRSEVTSRPVDSSGIPPPGRGSNAKGQGAGRPTELDLMPRGGGKSNQPPLPAASKIPLSPGMLER